MPLALRIVAFAVVHPVAQVGWTAWTIHWSTVIGLAALGATYTWGARHLQSRAASSGGEVHVLRRSQQVAFFSGLAVIFFSLNGPLHDLSDTYLFSAHMVQHLLLTMLFPPLIIAGTPGWMLRPLLSRRPIGAIARRLTRPVACFAIFNLVIAGWHLPVFYNAAMDNHN